MASKSPFKQQKTSLPRSAYNDERNEVGDDDGDIDVEVTRMVEITSEIETNNSQLNSGLVELTNFLRRFDSRLASEYADLGDAKSEDAYTRTRHGLNEQARLIDDLLTNIRVLNRIA